MKKRLVALLLVAAISACVSACGENITETSGDYEEYIIQEFELVESKLEEETMPEELPTEVEDYDQWTRETEEWCKVAETENAAIFANADDIENLYVSWNGSFVKCNWKDASVWESDIEMTESDIDRDGEKEVLVILHNNTGSSSGEDEFHLLDRTENDSFTDAVIPMEDFWKWVKEISAGWLKNAEIEDLYLYTTTVTESGLTIDAEIEKNLLHPLGKITVQMVWSDKTLQVKSFTFTTD